MRTNKYNNGNIVNTQNTNEHNMKQTTKQIINQHETQNKKIIENTQMKTQTQTQCTI